MAIGGYYIDGYWWTLMAIIFVAIGEYSINEYWYLLWLLY
jgi:hypothetical protein